jgi:Rrf2 family protein
MLSKTALHAVRAVAALAELPEGTYCGASTVAQQINAPQNYLGKLLQNLIQQSIVQSQRGQGGGFALATASTEISIYDIVESIDRVSRWEGCALGLDRCSSDKPCAIHDKWSAIRDSYLQMLRETTIHDIRTWDKGKIFSL